MFSKDEIKALLLIASKQAHRTNINGIQFDVVDGAVCGVATDGHRMLVIRNQPSDEQSLFSGFLSRVSAEDMVKTASRYDFMVHGTDGLVRLGRIGVALEQGHHFPSWRAVVPSSFSGRVAQFDAEYVGDFAKVGKLLGGKPTIAHNGESAALVGFGANAFGILMPMRDDAPSLPEWVHEPMPEAQAA